MRWYLLAFYGLPAWLVGFFTTVSAVDLRKFFNVEIFDDDYYYLAVQRCHPGDDFTIHGLWPNYANGSYPEYCEPGVHYDPTEISKDTLQEMEAYWFSCDWSSYTNEEFWDHEVSKHYTCVFNRSLTQEDYFSTALDLYWKSMDNPAVKSRCESCEDQCLIPWSKTFDKILWT